jgi:multiple sugar transport system permease protein
MKRKALSVYKKIPQWGLLIPAALLLIIISIAPSVDALISSFNVGPEYVHDQKTVQVGLGNYRTLFKDRAIIFSLNITALWAAANTLVTGVVSVLLAHLMLKHKQARKHSIIHPLLMIPLGIPLYIAAPLWRAFIHGDAGMSWFFKLTGITMNLITSPMSAFIAVLIASTWINVPITTFVIYSHLSHVGSDLLDAARIDTKFDFEILRFITFPIIRSSFLTMMALNFVKAFKEFTLIHLMTNGGVPLVNGITERYIVGSTTTLGVFMYNLFGSAHYGVTAAFSVLMTASVAVVLIFWYCSTISQKAKQIIGFKVIVIFLFGLGILFDVIFLREQISILRLLILTGLLLSFKYLDIFPYTLIALLIYRILDIVFYGFLEGFSPLVPAVLFVLLFTKKNSSHKIQSFPTPKITLINQRISSTIGILLEVIYQIVRYGVVLIIGIVTIAIVYLLVRLSLSNLNACYFDTWLPSHISFQAFKNLFLEQNIIRYFFNTVLLAAGSAFLIPFIVIPAAWFLSSIKKERANGIVSSVHTLGTLGGMHSLVPLFSVFLMLGLLNTRTGLILVYVVHALPFALINMKNFFEGYAREMREPARIEGASTLQYMWYILVPLSRPIIRTSMLMAFLGAWNGFNAPLLLLTDEKLYPVSLKLYTYVGSIASGNPQWNLFAAASLINLAIIALIGGRKLSKDPT